MGRAFEFRKARKMKRWSKMAKTFTRIGIDIVIAVNEGGSRPETNSPEEFSFDQDIRLRLRSTVHRIISINLEFATDQEPFYNSDIRSLRSSRSTAADSQSVNIFARQSYLEFNRNPNEESKIGKQVINIGDRKGKVFTGILSGFSQRCKAGTWCYEIGGMKLSSAAGDWLYYFSLDYPFWHEVDSQG